MIICTLYFLYMFYMWILCSPTTKCTNLCSSALKVNLHMKADHLKVSKFQTLSISGDGCWSHPKNRLNTRKGSFPPRWQTKFHAALPHPFCLQQPLCKVNFSPGREEQHHLGQRSSPDTVSSHFCCQQWIPSSRSSWEMSEHTQPHTGTVQP